MPSGKGLRLSLLWRSRRDGVVTDFFPAYCDFFLVPLG